MTGTQADPQVSTPAPPNRRAIAWWWIAAIFVVAVIIAAAAVIVLSPRPEPATPPLTGPPGACSVPAGAQTVPTSTPAGVEWKVSESKILLPFSTTAGPAQLQGPLARCYAKDPVGALLAASQIYPRAFLSTNSAGATEVVREQVVPGPQRDRLLESLSTPTDAPEQIQWRAFKYLSYTPESATIVMALESSGATGVVGLPITVDWLDGDWKYNFEKFEPGVPVDDEELTTYVQWSGLR